MSDSDEEENFQGFLSKSGEAARRRWLHIKVQGPAMREGGGSTLTVTLSMLFTLGDAAWPVPALGDVYGRVAYRHVWAFRCVQICVMGMYTLNRARMCSRHMPRLGL